MTRSRETRPPDREAEAWMRVLARAVLDPPRT